MIRPDQIPDEALYAAVFADDRGKDMSEAIAAALNAWPRSQFGFAFIEHEPKAMISFILPLPQEKNDDR